MLSYIARLSFAIRYDMRDIVDVGRGATLFRSTPAAVRSWMSRRMRALACSTGRATVSARRGSTAAAMILRVSVWAVVIFVSPFSRGALPRYVHWTIARPPRQVFLDRPRDYFT